MRFNRRQSPEEDAEFQMAPMIDVIFQLLIFFMVISNLHQLEGLEDVRLPVADQAKTIKNSYGQITINVTDIGEIVFGPEQEVLQLSELTAVLSDRPDETAKVLIRGDREVLHGRILEVMKACTEAGLNDISFATFQEEVAEEGG